MTFLSSPLPPLVRLPTDRLSSVLCKFSRKKIRLLLGCHPLDDVTGAVALPLSDDTL